MRVSRAKLEEMAKVLDEFFGFPTKGARLDAAHAWIGRGFDPDSAREWLARWMFWPSMAARLAAAGLTPEQAERAVLAIIQQHGVDDVSPEQALLASVDGRIMAHQIIQQAQKIAENEQPGRIGEWTSADAPERQGEFVQGPSLPPL